MDASIETPYPGSTASVREIVELANAYYNAAMELFKRAQKEAPLSYAPARFCAIHAIELYLNAFLRQEGSPPEQVRKRMHNLADPTFVSVLKLRKRTAQHLETISARREYLIARYGPEQRSHHTELNRLTATLVEVMVKAGNHFTGWNPQGLS